MADIDAEKDDRTTHPMNRGPYYGEARRNQRIVSLLYEAA